MALSRRHFPSLINSLSGLGCALAVTMLFSGCHPAITDPNDPKFIVAEKDDWKITRADLNTEIASFYKQKHTTAEQIGLANVPRLETAVLDNMVLKKLILARAATLPLKDVDKEANDTFEKVKAHYPTEKDFADQLQTSGMTVDELKARIHEQVTIHKVMEADVPPETAPTDEEINQVYTEHKEHFVKGPEVRVSRILVLVDDKTTPAEKVAKKKKIDDARARVAKGEDFAKVAAEVSEDRFSAPKGGDIAFFEKGVNEPHFDDIAFNSKVGVVSPVFETELGYQFLKVTDTHPGGVVPISDARSQIENYLRQQKIGQQQHDYAINLLKSSNVTFHLVRVDLPSPTAGAAGQSGEAPTAAPAGSAPSASSAVESTPPAPAPTSSSAK